MSKTNTVSYTFPKNIIVLDFINYELINPILHIKVYFAREDLENQQ